MGTSVNSTSGADLAPDAQFAATAHDDTVEQRGK